MENNFRTKGSPCYQCDERHRACWGECTRYQAWRATIDKNIMFAMQRKDENDMFMDVKKTGMKRARRKLIER